MTSFAEIRQAYAALLDRIRTTVRRRGYAIKAEQTYLHWIVRFITFLGNIDPSQQGSEHVARFLDDFGPRLRRGVSARRLVTQAPRRREGVAVAIGVPSRRISADPRSGVLRRHHLHENGLQKAVEQAAELAGITKRVGTLP